MTSRASALSLLRLMDHAANVLINAHPQSGGRWRIFLKKMAAGHLGSVSSKYCHRNNPLPFENFFVSCVLFFRLLYCFFWYPLQGRIQDFRFSGVEGTKWRAKCAVNLATPIFFVPEKRSFPPFSVLYTPYTEYSARRKY